MQRHRWLLAFRQSRMAVFQCCLRIYAFQWHFESARHNRRIGHPELLRDPDQEVGPGERLRDYEFGPVPTNSRQSLAGEGVGYNVRPFAMPGIRLCSLTAVHEEPAHVIVGSAENLAQWFNEWMRLACDMSISQTAARHRMLRVHGAILTSANPTNTSTANNCDRNLTCMSTCSLV